MLSFAADIVGSSRHQLGSGKILYGALVALVFIYANNYCVGKSSAEL
jgi:hypothetical protein